MSQKSLYIFKYSVNNNYIRTPGIETANFSQSHVDLNLSQFQADCLFCVNLNTATENMWINTCHCNNIDKWKILALDVTYLSSIVMSCIHYFFINDECITLQFKNLFNLFRALNTYFNYFSLLYLNFYEINNKSEIETNLWSQSQAFDCIRHR